MSYIDDKGRRQEGRRPGAPSWATRQRDRAEKAEAERDALRAQLAEARRHVEALVQLARRYAPVNASATIDAAEFWLKGGG